MNQYEFVLGIIIVVMFASIFKARYRYRHRRKREVEPVEQAETLRLREEVKELKERLKVLERITVDKENALAREIDSLRDH